MIYKIINNLNRKIYIGGTVKTNIDERFREHFSHAKKYNSQTGKMIDMRNIAKENWSIEKIEDCPNNQIKSMENYYIKYYKEQGFELYNTNINSNAKTTFYSCDLDTGEIKEYKSMKETGCNFSKLSGVLNNLGEKKSNGVVYYRFSHNNKLWSYKNDLENWKKLFFLNREKCGKKKKILCVEKGLVYNSITEANIDLGLNKKHSSIINCLRKSEKSGKPRKALGYHWKRVDEEIPKWAL